MFFRISHRREDTHTHTHTHTQRVDADEVREARIGDPDR